MPTGVSIVLVEGFAKGADPTWVRPEGYQQAMEFVVGDDADVDSEWNRLVAAGYHGRMAPTRNAGPYAAMVDDPDGNVVLLSSDPDADPASRPTTA
jgi:hypothetical protein